MWEAASAANNPLRAMTKTFLPPTSTHIFNGTHKSDSINACYHGRAHNATMPRNVWHVAGEPPVKRPYSCKTYAGKLKCAVSTAYGAGPYKDSNEPEVGCECPCALGHSISFAIFLNQLSRYIFMQDAGYQSLVWNPCFQGPCLQGSDIGAIRHELLQLLGVPMDVVTPKRSRLQFASAYSPKHFRYESRMTCPACSSR